MFSSRVSSKAAANVVRPMFRRAASLPSSSTTNKFKTKSAPIFQIPSRNLDFSKFSYKTTAEKIKFRKDKIRRERYGSKPLIQSVAHTRLELPNEHAELAFANGMLEDMTGARAFALEKRTRLPTGYMNDFPPC